MFANSTKSNVLGIILGAADSDYGTDQNNERKSMTGYCFSVYGNIVSWRSKLQPITANSTFEAELIALAFASDEAIWFRHMIAELDLYEVEPKTVLLLSHLSNVFPIDSTHETKERVLLSQVPWDSSHPNWGDVQSVTNGELLESEFIEKQNKKKKKGMPPTQIMVDNRGTVFSVNNPSTSARSKHIDVRFYRTRQRIESQDISPYHSPREFNISDFFTHPSQPESFKKFRNAIMGHHDSNPSNEYNYFSFLWPELVGN
jgi:hypothetical protein